MPRCTNCAIHKETNNFDINKRTKKQYKCCNKCRLRLNTPRAKEQRKLYHQKKATEKRIKKLEKFIQENPDHATKIYQYTNCKEYKKYSQFGLGQRGIRTKCADYRNKRKPYFETYFKKKRKIGAYKGQYLIRKAKKLQTQKWKLMKEHNNVQDTDNIDLSSNSKDLPTPTKQANQLKDRRLVQVIIFRKDSEKGIQIMLSQRIHPDKPYLGLMQGTGGKVDVHTNDYGYETLETEENTAMRETLEESGIILEEGKLQKIWSETVPSQLEWTTRRCDIQQAEYNVTLSIFIYP
ncbi:hypothetical protein C2G38_2301626 [Gigaspora rosea]|uniref:Nudix hydrolase domain-containing protein n=1 Tax=Gigaspora rosea TaxID=44941 RepID=A0A397VPD1_9GLOM|nr:hypothetical protein C2G38_2301626 [Gigaspora rosea]